MAVQGAGYQSSQCQEQLSSHQQWVDIHASLVQLPQARVLRVLEKLTDCSVQGTCPIAALDTVAAQNIGSLENNCWVRKG